MLVLAAWGISPVAIAGAVPNTMVVSSKASGILIAWNEGKTTLEHITLLAAENPQMMAHLNDLPGGLETLKEGRWPAPDIQAVSLPDGTPIDQALGCFSSLPGVRYVEPDSTISADATKVDPYYSKQWFFSHLDVEKTWDVEKDSSGLVVAVLDTGVDGSHPDLAGRVLKGYNFVGEDENTQDVFGHGTHSAGIIAASGDNGVGVAGLAWGAKILPVKVLDDIGCGGYSNLIAGIRYAADNGASVINMSLGGGARSQALQETLDYARSKGAVLVAATGNNALDSLSYPAACTGVVAVGATDERDCFVSFSNYGEGLDLVAPGISIYSDAPNGKYTYESGTSTAAPQVSGAFALLLSREPGLGVDEAEQRIFLSARDLGPSGYDTSYGWGLLQVDKALGLYKETPVNENTSGGNLFFAEGYTGAGFEEWLCLMNPTSSDASVAITYMFADGTTQDESIPIKATSKATVNVNTTIGADKDVSIKVSSTTPIVAERPIYFDYKGKWTGGHDVLGTTSPESNFYFAEGYTGSGFDEWLCLMNPNLMVTTAHITYMFSDGTTQSRDVAIGPTSRATVDVNSDVGPDKNVSIQITSDSPIVAERPMYFNYQGKWTGGSDVVGIAAPQKTFYFAEGYTGNGDFDEWLCLQNPNTTATTAHITYMFVDGNTQTQDVVIGVTSRATVDVNDVVGPDKNVSIQIISDDPIVAERPMYFNYKGKWTGGHDVIGAPSPQKTFYFAEGYTGVGFDEWRCLLNPGSSATTAHVTYMFADGITQSSDVSIGATSRVTVDVNNDIGLNKNISTQITSDDPIVVERPVYFNYKDKWTGGHDVMGYVP